MRLSHLLASLCFVVSASLALAQFSGDFAVGTQGTFSVTTGNSSFGNWTANLSTLSSGGSASVITSDAPNSLTLSATGFANLGTGMLRFTADAFTTSGLISFSTNISNQAVYLDNTPIAAATYYSFEVAAGQELSFRLTATGTSAFTYPGTPIFDPISMTYNYVGGYTIPGQPITSTIAISNFTFTPTAIPEPSTYALAAGLGALAIAAYRRRA